MLREDRSQSHREHLITKTNPGLLTVKISALYMLPTASLYFIQYLCVCTNKCVWWWKGHTQTMCVILNTDFLVFPFVGFLHLSHCSFLVSLEEAVLPCLTFTSSLGFHSALLHSWSIYSDWAISFITFASCIKNWSSWRLSESYLQSRYLF